MRNLQVPFRKRVRPVTRRCKLFGLVKVVPFSLEREMLRKHKRYASVAGLAAALAGCLAGCTSATSTVYAAAPASKAPTTLAKASVPASALGTDSVSASPSAVPL